MLHIYEITKQEITQDKKKKPLTSQRRSRQSQLKTSCQSWNNTVQTLNNRWWGLQQQHGKKAAVNLKESSCSVNSPELQQVATTLKTIEQHGRQQSNKGEYLLSLTSFHCPFWLADNHSSDDSFISNFKLFANTVIASGWPTSIHPLHPQHPQCRSEELSIRIRYIKPILFVYPCDNNMVAPLLHLYHYATLSS